MPPGQHKCCRKGAHAPKQHVKPRLAQALGPTTAQKEMRQMGRAALVGRGDAMKGGAAFQQYKYCKKRRMRRSNM